MAAKARARSREFSRQFWTVLSHACSECCLIIMLLVTAVVSYTATRFARICRLRSPCMLCSRLDHALYGKAWFSEELVCAAHRLEISSLSYCQSHNKLANSDDLCERCLLSCAALVGKPGNLTNVSPWDKANSRSRSRRAQLCSCCSEPFKKTRNEHRTSEIANGRVQDNGFDHLPHGSYRKLKIRRDSGSEIRISDDDDDANAMLHEARQLTKDMPCHDVQLQPMISRANGLSMPSSGNTVLAKPMNTAPLVPLYTATVTDNQPSDANLSNVAKSSDPSIGHGLEEINWSQVNSSDNNLDVQLKAVPEQVFAELPKDKTFLVGIEEVGDSEGVSARPDEETTKGFAASANAGTVKPRSSGTSSTADVHIDRNISMKNVSCGRGNLQSPRFSEIISTKDTNSKTQEEFKTFLSQLSSARGFDGPWSVVDTSPRISIQIDEYKESNATSARPSLEMNNSNLEPFDVNVTSEDDGESFVECLKRQFDIDKKKISVLYKELEAERSASAVAASEAMAMINRLQEEKAAMHMEALQYLRMMEEQADHDQEAIEKLNDLLTEREKEILDLEAELANYRRRLHDEPFDAGRFDAIDGDVAFELLDGSDFRRNTMFDFEDEKAKILESLSRLEETLGMSSTNRFDLGGAKDNLQDGLLRDHAMGGGQYVENQELECGSSLLPLEHLSGESISSQKNDENQSVENQKDFGSCSRLDDDKISAMTGVKHEISLLNTRFKALEADQKFLKQILSSLKCSNDGVQCVQEITSHLRELRRIITEQRETAIL